MPPEITTVGVDDADLTVAVWGSGRPDIVVLHDGLGSISQWRSVPGEVAARTGRTVLAYDRSGHGVSTPVPTGPWPADWLHREADRLNRLLEVLDIDRPLLVGHSDGGSIALLHAAGQPDRVTAVLTLAAHSWVEQRCFDSIVEMRNNRDVIVKGLARSHPEAEAVFEAWSGVWVGDEFRSWDIRPMLHTIQAPVLVVQGDADEYATPAHAVETAEAIGPNASHRLPPGVGHLLHHQDPHLVADLIVAFAEEHLA